MCLSVSRVLNNTQHFNERNKFMLFHKGPLHHGFPLQVFDVAEVVRWFSLTSDVPLSFDILIYYINLNIMWFTPSEGHRDPYTSARVLPQVQENYYPCMNECASWRKLLFWILLLFFTFLCYTLNRILWGSKLLSELIPLILWTQTTQNLNASSFIKYLVSHISCLLSVSQLCCQHSLPSGCVLNTTLVLLLLTADSQVVRYWCFVDTAEH